MEDKGGFAGVVLVGILGLFIGGKAAVEGILGLTTPTPDRFGIVPDWFWMLDLVNVLAGVVLVIACLALFVRQEWARWLAIVGFGAIAATHIAFMTVVGFPFFSIFLIVFELFGIIYLALASEAFEETSDRREPLKAPYKREH